MSDKRKLQKTSGKKLKINFENLKQLQLTLNILKTFSCLLAFLKKQERKGVQCLCRNMSDAELSTCT